MLDGIIAQPKVLNQVCLPVTCSSSSLADHSSVYDAVLVWFLFVFFSDRKHNLFRSDIIESPFGREKTLQGAMLDPKNITCEFMISSKGGLSFYLKNEQ